MAERKAVNKYYPPDWDPRKQGSANKRVGQHPLRDRAKKLSQGILVIRFELPYNIWCGGCGNHVGMGVRYNAEKSKVGNYYTTPIYKFRMKCHLCDNYFEIQTDPKNHDYVILFGARRKEQRWDPAENGQVVPEDKATQKRMATDPMYKLEHGSDDKQKGKDRVTTLHELESWRLARKDDYMMNRMARDKFRAEKKQLKEEQEADKAVLQRASLDIALLKETEEDQALAKLMKYSVTGSFEEKQKEKRESIQQRPLFDQEKLPASPSVSPSSTTPILPKQLEDRPGFGVKIKNKLQQVFIAGTKDPFSIRKSHNNLKAKVKRASLSLGVKLKSSLDKAAGKDEDRTSTLQATAKHTLSSSGESISAVATASPVFCPCAITDSQLKQKDGETEDSLPAAEERSNNISEKTVTVSGLTFTDHKSIVENTQQNSKLVLSPVSVLPVSDEGTHPTPPTQQVHITDQSESSQASLSAKLARNSSLVSLMNSYLDDDDSDSQDS